MVTFPGHELIIVVLDWRVVVIDDVKGLATCGILIKFEKSFELTLLEISLDVFLVVFECSLADTWLENLALVDLIFDTVGWQKPVDDDITLLADTITPVYRLIVISRVPVWIKNDCSVSSSQIESHSTDLRSEQEHKVLRVCLKLLNDRTPVFNLNITIDS